MAILAPPVTLVTKKRIALLLVLLLLLYVIIPRLGDFSDSVMVLENARYRIVIIATAFVIASYCSAAAVYTQLTVRHLDYSQTLQIQIASAFTNRLLPAGLGTLTLYVQYLRKHGHRLSQSIAVVGTNNALGMAAHLLLLLAVMVFGNQVLPARLMVFDNATVVIVAVLGALLIAGGLMLFTKLRQRVFQTLREIGRHIAHYRAHPLRLAAALGFSAVTTICYVAAFYYCGLAVGLHLGVEQLFFAFTIGTIIGTATPTPGGLIGAEAGLAGGLIAYGAQPDTALAAILLYRLLTYWLPLIPGFVLFIRIRRLYS